MNDNPYKSPRQAALSPERSTRDPDWFRKPFHPWTLSIILCLVFGIVVAVVVTVVRGS